jgi:hypothetical protein
MKHFAFPARVTDDNYRRSLAVLDAIRTELSRRLRDPKAEWPQVGTSDHILTELVALGDFIFATGEFAKN